MTMRLWICICCAILLQVISCTTESPREGAPSETALRGTVELYVDDQVYDVLLAAKSLYDAAHPDAHVTLVPRSALTIADDMIEHRIRGAVLARTWLPGEDSVVQRDRGADGFPRSLIARDALVFYASHDFPLDTLNAQDIEAWMLGGTVDTDVYPTLRRPPVFVVPGVESSVYANVLLQITKGKMPAKGSVASLSTRDSVRAAILSNPTSIGIGYLSQFVRDSTVKLLRLSYTDAEGRYVRPKPVHAAYLIMGKYPYPVPIYVVLKDRVSNFSLPSGFAQFMAVDGGAQRTFFDQGIEPGYAKIELVMPE